MRCDVIETSGHVTTKSSALASCVALPPASLQSSICKGLRFINPASTRGKLRVLPREICSVLKDQLSAGQLALSAGQESAEDIVGSAFVLLKV
jgi:hypothetical protein